MRRGAWLLGWLALMAPLAQAQGGPPPGVGRRTAISITGLPVTIANISAADFDAGFRVLGTATFTVDATSNNPAFSPRNTTVAVRCFSPCPATGTLAPTGLQWRRGDLGTWIPLTTTLALVETRTVTFGGANDPWSNTIQFRYVLDWATTAPTTAPTTFNVELELTVAAP